MVGPTEEQCIERAQKEGWTLGKSQGSFRANSKALAEGEGNGMAKVLFNKDTGKVVAVHIIGLHAADLIQECANAVAAGTTVQELSMMVHTHPVSAIWLVNLVTQHTLSRFYLHRRCPKSWTKPSREPSACQRIRKYKNDSMLFYHNIRYFSRYICYVQFQQSLLSRKNGSNGIMAWCGPSSRDLR
jgi:hypothetical protein